MSLQSLLEIAYRIMYTAERPLHVQEIKCKMLEATSLDVQLISQVDTAIMNDIQGGGLRFKEEEGSPGVFMISQKPTAQSIAVQHQQNLILVEKERQEKIYKKYKRLRKQIKQMVFLNSALCDEVRVQEEKLDRIQNERKFLLRRVLQHEAAASRATPEKPTGVTPHAAMLKKFVASLTAANKIETKPTVRKRPSLPSSTTSTRIVAKQLLADNIKAKSRKTYKSNPVLMKKRLPVQPIPLDATGKPLFPIRLGGLTVHSLGEVVSDRNNFHSTDYIYPMGFCSTREYASTKNPDHKCLYTCKITDLGNSPKFEISPDDDPELIIVGSSASECHQKLLEIVNKSLGGNALNLKGRGSEFFGFSHPTIQNLIQSSLGARKCVNYKWIRFEVSRMEGSAHPSIEDVSLSFEALQSNPLYQHATTKLPMKDETENLRSLLSSSVLNTEILQHPQI